MFDIIRSIKKITGLHKREQVEFKDVEAAPDGAKGGVLEHKIDKLSNFIDHFWASVIVEYRIVKEKFQDLSKANYDLGIRHLEEGNIKEAIFRFKITKKFWPHNYDAYYQLIYCLILDNEFEDAQKVIDELLIKNPSYKEKIDQLLSPSEDQDPEEAEEAEAESLGADDQQNPENPNQQ
jgi:tetratricopeptide (TPR) repeat protein